MAYVKRFWGEFADRYNRTITVEIYKNNYSGAADEMKFTDDPLSWNHPGDDNDIRKSIFGKELTINIMSMTDFQYLELHSSDARGFKVKVLIDGSLDFEGWILPDLFTEPYVAPPYPVSVSARCGLAELKEIDCPQELGTIRIDEIAYGEYTSNKVNLLTLIYRGLREITDNSTIEIHENVNVYPDTSEPDTSGYSPLWYTFVNLEEYEEMTWYEAIEDALKALNCRLYQKNGIWRIRRIWEREQIMRKQTIVFDGEETFLASLDFTETYTPTYKIGKPESRFLVGGGQLDILPALKKYTIQNKFSLNENIFINGDFKDTKSGVSGFRLFGWDDTSTIYPVKNWQIPDDQIRTVLINQYDATAGTISTENVLHSIFLQDEERAVMMYGRTNHCDVTRMYQKIGIDSGEKISYSPVSHIEQSLLLSVNIAALGFFETNENNVDLKIKYTGTLSGVNKTYYLERKETSDGYRYYWNESEKTIGFDIPLSTFDTLQFEEISLFTSYLSLDDGEIEFMIINRQSETVNNGINLLVSSVNAKIAEYNLLNPNAIEVPIKYSEQINNNFTINEKNVKVGETIELVSGDLPDVPNNAKIWNGGFRLVDDTPVTKWHQAGETTELPIAQLNALQFSSLKLVPQFKLSLPIMSNDIDFDKNIVDYQILPKEYICNSFNYNYRNCIGEGTYIEMATWDGADWILEDGTWNDQGIWIDGETWNDEDPIP